MEEQYFRGTWLRWRTPRRALLASLLWHISIVLILVLLLPLLHFPSAQSQLPPVRIEVTWYQPPTDLPDLSVPGPPRKPSPPGEPHKPLPRRGADAFHPRQTILSQPVKPTHPRQTLIQPDAPPEPPKISPPLPNIVQWSESPAPARPRLHINPSVLSALHPRRRARKSPVEDPVIPEIANQEKAPTPFNIASSSVINDAPKLPLSPGTVARPTQQKTAADAGPAPDLGPNVSAETAGSQRLIALSADPAPAPPPEIPQGNLSARLSISPEGTQPGVPGGSPNGTPGATGSAGGGPGSPGGTGGAAGTRPGVGGGNGGAGPIGVSISISGGSPNANISGPASPAAPGSHSNAFSTAAPSPAKIQPGTVDSTRTRPDMGPKDFDTSQPPEQILRDKRIYTLYVNMPNLTSSAGSWVLNFSELYEAAPGPRGGSDLVGPVPLRKVDPKYPPTLINAHVEGDVVLYAIIRLDGSVDSIQLLKSVDPELDQNAMQAMARWRFRPAQRHGAPVELEAVIHIPFRAGGSL